MIKKLKDIICKLFGLNNVRVLNDVNVMKMIMI